MPNTIKVGVITNAGGAHLSDYFTSLARTDEVEGVYLADPSGASFDQARRVLGARLQNTYRDVADMLRQAQPRLALVTVEAAQAPPLINQALDAGCHILTEKPGCVRAEDFSPLVQKAQRTHRHLMLALANRLHAPVREARRMIADGRLGRVWGVEIHLIADQTRLTRPEARGQWFYNKARSGGGCLSWLGIHWLDAALFITGRTVRQVAGFAGVVGGQQIEVEDAAAMSLRLDNDTFATMTCGYFLDRGYQTHIQVWGQHGWLRFAGFEEQPLEWYTNAEGRVQRFEYPRGGRGYAPFVRAAVRASADLEAAPISGEEGLHVLRTIFAFYQAAQTGQTQRL